MHSGRMDSPNKHSQAANASQQMEDAKAEAMQQFLPHTHITKRFLDWSKTKLCDEFLLATVQFVSAHFKIVRNKIKKNLHLPQPTRKCDCLERFKEECPLSCCTAPNEKGRRELIDGDSETGSCVAQAMCEQIVQKCDAAVPLAEAEKLQAQTALGLKYAEVLRANLEHKFDVNTKPYDETAFYEAVYKFVNYTVRQYRVNQKLLCPPAMWKELDVVLGCIFRGEDFNLEERGLVPDPNEIGAWMPRVATGRTYKKINIHAAISRRSPAVALTYKDQVVSDAKKPGPQRPRTAPAKRPLAKANVGGIAAAFTSPGMVQMTEAVLGTSTLGPQLFNQQERARQARVRPKTATVRASRPQSGQEQRRRPSSAKTTRAVPNSRNSRPGSAKQRPSSASTSRTRPLSASSRTSRLFSARDGEVNRPWAAHENWKPAVSLVS